MAPKDKYTDPDLRDEVKEEIHQGDKGGAPGQWSARKAQMMASEYKKRGGGYTTDKKDQDDSQKHLTQWTNEDWQTKEGSGHAKQDDGTEKRYLPKKAWDQMSEQEKKETDDKKLAESKEGKQFVQNTDKAKESRKKAAHEEEEDEESKSESESESNDKDTAKEDEKDAHTGDKRAHPSTSTSSSSPSKKQKQDPSSSPSSSPSKSKNDDPPAKPASKDRLPEKDQTAYYKTSSSYTAAKVLEIAYEEKEVEGKKVKASEEDPRIVLKSDKTGAVVVHKVEGVWFD